MSKIPLPLVFASVLQNEVEKEKESILEEYESRLNSSKRNRPQAPLPEYDPVEFMQ